MCCDQPASNLPKVHIGIPSYGSQPADWWFSVLLNLIAENHSTIEITKISVSRSMMRDNNKNSVVGVRGLIEDKRLVMTDANRMGIVDGFLADDADWLFFIDDDTVFPKGDISQMVKLQREFVSGVYFQDGTYNPVAYFRRDDGMYDAVADFPKNALFQVDSVGLGCALIHKSVFEKIMAAHVVYTRPNGSLQVVHKDQIKDKKEPKGAGEPYVRGGYLHIPLRKPSPYDDRPWPFFALEWSRTEDHYFCELAANVGVRPWLDTSIICDHIKTKPVTFKDFEESRGRA